jgi:protein-disulfide isomerase
MDNNRLTRQERREKERQQEKLLRRGQGGRGQKANQIVTWGIIGITVAAVIAAIIFAGGSNKALTVAPVTDADHIVGSRTAPAVLIEYSDFQCPACTAYYTVVKNLEAKYGEKLAVVYRNYPLTQLHKNAQLAAQAAEAANLQGAFWPMHDILFDRQDAWANDTSAQQIFTNYATELKLDVAKFGADIDSSVVKDRVAVDVASGNAVGLTGTPTFFLNGTKMDNPGSEQGMINIIDKALAGK